MLTLRAYALPRYLAHGTATDYMYDVLHVPLAMTWEIYGDMKAHFNDCFRMFNPLGQKDYKQVGGAGARQVCLVRLD